MKRWAGLILNLMGCVLIVLVLTIVMLADADRADRALPSHRCEAPTDAVQLIQWHGCTR